MSRFIVALVAVSAAILSVADLLPGGH